MKLTLGTVLCREMSSFQEISIQIGPRYAKELQVMLIDVDVNWGESRK